MIVGVVAYRYDYYPYVRNIIGIVQGVNYQKAKDLFAYLNAVARTINRAVHREVISTFDLNNQFWDGNFNRVDLVHLFNGVSYCHTPWVSTFETVLPRFRSSVQALPMSARGVTKDRKLDHALKALAGPGCKRIIAISECTANMQREWLSNFSIYRDSILNKMTVMHPPQKVFIERFDEKQVSLDSRIRFMLVGNAFFRKGGPEIIKTLKKLRDQYRYELELTVVSDLSPDGYVMPVDPEMIRLMRKEVNDNREWITYYPHLPNNEVLDLMKKAHVGLLPTYADTYGYSVLEFQANGCPVITTDVRSLPEINNNDHGWVIPVPKNHLGEASYETVEGRKAISQAICKGLEASIHDIFADKAVIHQKADQSILNIKTKHSLSEFSAGMKKIYQEALG